MMDLPRMADGEGSPLVTSEMEEEERLLEMQRAKQDEADLEAARKAYEEKGVATSAFAKLDALLEKTRAYSQFLFERMENVKLEEDSSGAAGKPGDSGKRPPPARGRGKSGKRAKSSGKGAPDAALAGQALADIHVPDGMTEADALLREQHELVPILTGGALKSYQIKGIKWLISLYQNGLNGILADQMGLGKTVQTIGFLAHLRSQGIVGPYLVVAPLSTLPNWISEFHRWTPSVPVILYHGSREERSELRSTHLSGGISASFPVVVTSFEVVINDRRFLQRYRWKYIVVDEGQRLKNFNCKLIRELRQLPADNSLLLSGTPLQNNLKELWSLLNFLMPDIFSSVEEFTSWFDFADQSKTDAERDVGDEERRVQIVAKLHGILRPFLLRRLKEDVEKNLPKKKEIILYAQMTKQQQEFTELLVKRTLDNYLHAKRDSQSTSKKVLNNVVMQLRKNCNHPDLLTSDYDDSLNYPPVDELLQQCGKMQLLDRLLTHLKRHSHKVLIFSQMTKLLDILEYFLEQKGHHPLRIDGGVHWSNRQGQIREFQTNPERFVFLLSTRAGGLGINLTAADTVIIYDSDWNPHQDMQAMDRCHRIGQLRPVHVYRLATAHSVECRMLQVARRKLTLERLVIEKGEFKQEKKQDSHSESADHDIIALLRPSQNAEEELVQSADISDKNLELLMDRSDMVEGSDQSSAKRSFPSSGPGWEVMVTSGAQGSLLSAVN